MSDACVSPWRSQVFRVGDSFPFAVNIPDDRVGIAGSRCSYCGSESAYADDWCYECGLPFVGPFLRTGVLDYRLLQLPGWESLPLREHQRLVREVFWEENHGRLGGPRGILQLPLTPDEARRVEDLSGQAAHEFERYRGMEPHECRRFYGTAKLRRLAVAV